MMIRGIADYSGGVVDYCDDNHDDDDDDDYDDDVRWG